MTNLLSLKDRPLSDLIAPLKKYSSTGEINIRTGHRDEIMEVLMARYPDAKTDTLDGLTIELPGVVVQPEIVQYRTAHPAQP